MMKKNTILKILSFVLVLTMVVAAVLLTGCGNKKEDPKASQAELDAAKAALEAAQAEIEKIQANIDKMTKDGSATADDLKKAQEELEAAQKALEELSQDTTAVVSEDVYEALYGKDSEKSIAKYQKKVKDLAAAKTNRFYIVGYEGDDADQMSDDWFLDMDAPELPGKARVSVTVTVPAEVNDPGEEPDKNATYDQTTTYPSYEDAKVAYDLAKDAYEKYVAYVNYTTAKAAYDGIFADGAEEALTIEKIADTAEALYDAIKAAYDKGLVEKNDWLIYSANYTKYQADIAQYVLDKQTYDAYLYAQATLADAKNYQAYRASEVYSVYRTCMNWVNTRLELATNAGVIDQVWADMEAAFAGIKKIVDKYDDELASLMPDAEGGKLTVIKYDRYGNKIDQLATLKAYHNWIATQQKLKFNDATTDGSEAPSEKNYKALLAAYEKIWNVDAANNAALDLAEKYGVADTSAIKITFTPNGNGTYTQDDKKANDALGKFYTTFVVYYEVTEKDATGNEDTNIYLVNDYTKIVKNNNGEFVFTGKYVYDGKELSPVLNNGQPTGKFTVNGQNVVVKAFKFADIFNKDANTDAQYYVATDITKDLSGNAMYFARDARYTELLAAKAEFASLYTQMATLKNYKTTLPLYSDCAALEGDLKKLADFQEKYKLAKVEWYTEDEIAKMELSGDALAAFKAQNDENYRMNVLNAAICKQIFDQIDNGANAYGTNGSQRIYTISELVKALKALKEELVDPVVESTNKPMTTLLAEWSSANVDTVKYADFDIYEDVDKRLNGYYGKDENGNDLWINGVVSHIYNTKNNSKYTAFAQYSPAEKANAVRDILDLSVSGYNTVNNLLARANTLDAINTAVKTLAKDFRDNNTRLVTAKVDVTGKETTVKVLDERTGQSETRYWVITFKTSNRIAAFAEAVDNVFKTNIPGCFGDDGIKADHKDNYDLILKETKAAEFLDQATKTFDTLKKPFDDAYKAVKDVIYSIDVDDDGNETLVTENGEYLQTLANLLWARDTITTLESGADYKGNDFANPAAGHSGQFQVDAIDTTANDVTTTTTITYGKFRTDLNTAVATATSKASLANAAATTNINTPLAATTEIVKDVAEPKLSAYASLNQYADANTVVANFRTWCVTYLGAKQTHEEDILDDDGEPTGFTEWVPYTDEEFFANVAEYFKPATADGKATGILNITNNYITYTFVSAENFATLQTITAAKDTMYANATATFLDMLSAYNDLLPEYATKENIDSVCAAFVNYVKAYYMQNGESLEAVNAAYNVVSASAFKTNAGKIEVQKKLAAETWVEKAARYATYIINPTEYCINPEEQVLANRVYVNDKALYNVLETFIADYYKVEAAENAISAADFFGLYPRYTTMVTANGDKRP